MNKECPICLHNLSDNIIVTKCNHTFCKNCLDKWQKNNSSCPICRQNITDKNLLIKILECLYNIFIFDDTIYNNNYFNINYHSIH